jgi:serine/threonine protein kinase
LGEIEHTTQFSENFKDLFNRMVCFEPKEKINLDEIKNHPWLTEDDKDNCLLNHEIFEKEFYRRKRIVDERKKRNIGDILKKMCEKNYNVFDKTRNNLIKFHSSIYNIL